MGKKDKPLFQDFYRTRPRERKPGKEELKRILKMDIFDPSTSKWESPIVFSTNKNVCSRFSVNYRKLNNVKNLNSNPILRMDE